MKLFSKVAATAAVLGFVIPAAFAAPATTTAPAAGSKMTTTKMAGKKVAGKKSTKKKSMKMAKGAKSTMKTASKKGAKSTMKATAPAKKM